MNGNGTVAAALQGTGGLSATAGISTLSNLANSYSGGTTIGNGASQLRRGQHTRAHQRRPGTGIVLSGGALSLTLSGPLTLGSGLTAQVYNFGSGINNGGENVSNPGYNPAFGPYLNGDYTTFSGYFLSGGIPGRGSLAASTLTTANPNGPNGTLNFTGNPPFGNIGVGNTGNYNVAMTGSINIAQAGVYTFSTASDDGSMLFIDGQTVVSNNAYQGTTSRSGTIDITTTGMHQIAIGYYQGQRPVFLVPKSDGRAGHAATQLPQPMHLAP